MLDQQQQQQQRGVQLQLPLLLSEWHLDNKPSDTRRRDRLGGRLFTRAHCKKSRAHRMFLTALTLSGKGPRVFTDLAERSDRRTQATLFKPLSIRNPTLLYKALNSRARRAVRLADPSAIRAARLRHHAPRRRAGLANIGSVEGSLSSVLHRSEFSGQLVLQAEGLFRARVAVKQGHFHGQGVRSELLPFRKLFGVAS